MFILTLYLDSCGKGRKPSYWVVRYHVKTRSNVKLQSFEYDKVTRNRRKLRRVLYHRCVKSMELPMAPQDHVVIKYNNLRRRNTQSIFKFERNDIGFLGRNIL